MRQVARAKKITVAALERVPAFIDQGLSASDIANAIGCTVGTLRVKCSQMGISLRRRNRNEGGIAAKHFVGGAPKSIQASPPRQAFPEAPDRRSTGPCPPSQRANASYPNRRGIVSGADQTPLTLLLPRMTIDQLRQRAALKGLSASVLVSILLEIIARDRLYEAVLDEREDSEPVPGQRDLDSQ